MKSKFMLTSALSILAISTTFAQGKKVPGLDLIGKTYNIFTGEYADNRSVKSAIFDFSKVPTTPVNYLNGTYSIPEIFEYTNIVSSRSKTTSGESASEISESLSTAAGLKVDAMVFSASVSTDIFNSRNENTYNYYSNYSYIVENHRISLKQVSNVARRERFIESIKPYLTNDFNEDINDPAFKAQDIFKTYGTHFLAEIILGAKIEQNTRIESNSQLNKSSIEVAVEAQYKAVGGNFKLGTEQSSNQSDKKLVSKYNAKGGDIAKLGTDNTNDSKYSVWASTVKNNPVLVDFTENSLIPIWELANTPTRKAELKYYFDNVLSKQYPKVKSPVNAPKPKPIVKTFNSSNPVALIVNADMKGVKKGSSILGISNDYDNIKVKLSTQHEKSPVNSSYWYFYQQDKANSNRGNSKYLKSGHTSKAKYYDGVYDRVQFLSSVITPNEEGKFYIFIHLENDNSSGARPANRIEFGKWVKCDEPISVKTVNEKGSVKVKFFQGDLEFDLQFQ